MDTWNNKADETLVALYAKGENQAFNVLLNRYKDKLYTYIYYISIDGSILILYYLYCLSIFQRTCASFSKAGAKVRGFILTAKLFGSFFVFLFRFVSQALLAKGKEGTKTKNAKPRFFANRTAKIRTLFIIIQTFSEVFCSFL